MAKVYYVRNKQTREILNLKGGWSKATNSYRVMEFDTEEAAKAAFPAGVDCEAISAGKRTGPLQPDAPVLMRMTAGAQTEPEAGVTVKFFVRIDNSFLDKNDKFALKTMHADLAASFDSRETAIDKADSLGLNLDSISITSRRVLSR